MLDDNGNQICLATIPLHRNQKPLNQASLSESVLKNLLRISMLKLSQCAIWKWFLHGGSGLIVIILWMWLGDINSWYDDIASTTQAVCPYMVVGVAQRSAWWRDQLIWNIGREDCTHHASGHFAEVKIYSYIFKCIKCVILIYVRHAVWWRTVTFV